jgi:hypothetical protein
VTHDVNRWACRDRRLADGTMVRADNTPGRRDVSPHKLRKAGYGWRSLRPSTDGALRMRWPHERRYMSILFDNATSGERMRGVDRRRRIIDADIKRIADGRLPAQRLRCVSVVAGATTLAA